MPLVIREEVLIAASLETVWRVFADIENWDRWNPVCRECRWQEGRSLETGACLSFALRPLVFPVRIAPVVTRCRPRQTVVWTGSKWGLHAKHAFLFSAVEEGVRLESVERFSGWMLGPLRLAGVPRRLHRLTIQLLQSIRSAAESQSDFTSPVPPVRAGSVGSRPKTV